MIEISDVTWAYPNATAPSLRDLDLAIAPGEFVVLCGASGSGKSTALRLINGLVPHFHERGELHGRVTVDGLVTADAELDAIGLRTGTVLQHPRRQFFADSAREELAFTMENFGYPPERIRARVESDLQDLSCHLAVDRRLQHLSGGQQQQVAIASSTTHEPRILLLDEPSSNLSVDAVARLRSELTALKAQGMTIVVAEHRLRYLETLVDRVVVMRNGTIDVEWSAEEFREVSDEALAREGLRGDMRPAVIPALPAAGRSVSSPVPVDQVPEGALELTGLSCSIGGHRVLELDRVAFPAGTVTAIRGVNGAGKSTLARVVTGLRRAAGDIRHGGRAMSPRRLQRSSFLVMQDVQRQLFTETVRAEIELASPDSGSWDETSELLRSLDLGDLVDRHPLSLSGGQQQRLVVAAARVSGRPIVVFDEPSSGVDRRHLSSISDQIRQVAREGAVVLLVSHDEDLLALAADQHLTLTPLEGA